MSTDTPPMQGTTIRVTITLLHDRFDAGVDGTPESEWPPEPYRVFAALRSGAAGLRLTQGAEAEAHAVAALRHLECSPPPIIWASAAVRHAHAGFVPVIPDFRSSNPTAIDVGKMSNRLKANSFPDITTQRGLRVHQSAFPDVPVVAFDIDASVLTDEDIRWLRLAAIEIPYFGRSTSPALVSIQVIESTAPGPLGTNEHRPGRGNHRMATWRPGLLDALDDKHEGLRTDMPMLGRVSCTSEAYHIPDSPDTPEPQWITLEHSNAPYRSLAQACKALRTLKQQLGPAEDLTLLANVGNRFGNGRLAIAISCPPGSDTSATLLPSLTSMGWEISTGGRWLSRNLWVKDSNIFATAIPVQLPTRNRDEAHRLALQRAEQHGLVEDITVSQMPILLGATRIPDSRSWHVALKFKETVKKHHFPLCLGEIDGTLIPLSPSPQG